jgi:hypothetical protein
MESCVQAIDNTVMTSAIQEPSGEVSSDSKSLHSVTEHLKAICTLAEVCNLNFIHTGEFSSPIHDVRFQQIDQSLKYKRNGRRTMAKDIHYKARGVLSLLEDIARAEEGSEIPPGVQMPSIPYVLFHRSASCFHNSS